VACDPKHKRKLVGKIYDSVDEFYIPFVAIDRIVRAGVPRPYGNIVVYRTERSCHA